MRGNHVSQLPGYLALLGVLILYVGLRILGWQNDPLFEDHDSVVLMNQALTYRSLDADKIAELDAAKTPLYPGLVALVSTLGWPIDFSARLVSFLSSLVLFGALVSIGQRFMDPVGIGAGLAFLAISPEFIRLSYSLLTEPTYVATVYLGLAVFLAQSGRPRTSGAIGAGVVFGLAFLNRVEGILFLFLIPLLQFLHRLLVKDPGYDLRHCTKWCGLFVLVFVLVIAPQVISVSTKMGQFALNGRQVWVGLLAGNESESTYERKIHGLDFSPREVNISYLMKHPEARQANELQLDLWQYAKKLVHNFEILNRRTFVQLIPPFCILLFGIGLLSLLQKRQIFEVLTVLGVVAAGLIAPLMHNVVIRHIAVIAPLIMLIAGLGVVAVVNAVGSSVSARARSMLTPVLLLVTALTIISPQVRLVKHLIRDPDTSNWGYRPADFVEMTAILRRHRESRDVPLIAARELYLPFFAGVNRVRVPYATYEELVNYLSLNHADYFLLNETSMRNHPFFAAFDGKAPPPFELVYRGKNFHADRLELYRFGHSKLP